MGEMPMARVLVVDDDLGFIRSIATTLQDVAEVRIATSGLDALRSVQRWLPDIVVLDVLLEDTDGFWLLERLVDREDAPQPFVLCAVSGNLTRLRTSRASGWPVGVISRSAPAAEWRWAVLDALDDGDEPAAAWG
jgi:CheY-like chemotaxis protein